jgi:amidase
MTYNGIIAELDISQTQLDSADTLEGLRFAVKDIFAVAGRTTGFGNPDWLRTHLPEDNHAEVISQLLQAKARLVAITCSDEMAFSLDGINIHYGTPINSQLPDRIPGGSSSGSASAVAAGLVDFALGTDTAGSIRVPASYCGIWGLRPTYGAISSQGVLPLGPSFDTVAVLARSRDVLERVTSQLLEQSNKVEQPLKPVRKLLIVDDFFALLEPSLAPHLVAATERARAHFDSVEHIKLSDSLDCSRLVEIFNAIRAFEAWQCHGRWLESNQPNLAPAIKERFFNCKDATEDEAIKGQQERAKLRQKLAALVNADTALCFPTTTALPPLKLASTELLQQNRMANMALCTLASLSGFPQISIPISVSDRKPIVKTGLSLLANSGMDLAIINAAAAFE